MDAVISSEALIYFCHNTWRHLENGVYLLSKFCRGLWHNKQTEVAALNNDCTRLYRWGPALQWQLHLDTLSRNKCLHWRTGKARYLRVYEQG
jgi:hypothetical protein